MTQYAYIVSHNELYLSKFIDNFIITQQLHLAFIFNNRNEATVQTTSYPRMYATQVKLKLK